MTPPRTLLHALRTVDMALVKVALFAALVLCLETVLFHVTEYLFEYVDAVMIVSCAVLGLGLGAFAAGTFRLRERTLLLVVCGGTAVALAASVVALLHPPLWRAMVVLPLTFAFPAWYVSDAFARLRTRRVYFYDMLGVSVGVSLTVAAYLVLRSEGILLVVMGSLALAGLVGGLRWAPRPVVVGFALLLATTVALLVAHGGWDVLNFHHLVSRDNEHFDRLKVFRSKLDRPVRSYDNLVGRVDVLWRVPSRGECHVAYNGYGNDHFTEGKPRDYAERYQGKGVQWPTQDVRFMYGTVPEPRVMIVGSAAQGIIKSVRRITPLDRIHTVEINPAIVRIMERDFYKRSGRAFAGLEPTVGNALSVIKTAEEPYDLITLMNVHSGRTVSYPGAPDCLHTVESYRLFLDSLSDDGLLSFEERPLDREGQLGLYRMIHTLWRALEAEGVEDPSKHFVIWEWYSRSGAQRVKRLNNKYYVGMAVSRGPLEGPRRELAREWFGQVKTKKGKKRRWLNLMYFPGETEDREISALMGMIRLGDFAPLAAEGFDPTPATDDRPFVSMSERGRAKIASLMKVSGIATAVAVLLFSIRLFGGRRTLALPLGGYQLLIGFAYFLVEVQLIQVYQAVFVSPATTLVAVLALLLLSSGVGGWFSDRIPLWVTLVLLAPVALLGVWAPGWLLGVGAPVVLVKGGGILCIAAVGALMGVYFPRGLALAKRAGLGARVPEFFALNAAAGAFAVACALAIAVQYGYLASFGLALALYAVATVGLWGMEKKVSG